MLERMTDSDPVIQSLVRGLDEDGIAVLPSLLDAQRLSDMQRAFSRKLKRLRWNDFDGYEQTELYRHMVHDVLTLEQGFVDIALHPIIKSVLSEYLGPNYELTEAKGWKSLPTNRDFHGWHGDAWYEQEGAKEIHREVKLAMYLTDVTSGAFNYIKGSHRKQHPRMVKSSEVRDVSEDQIVKLLGPAGSAFLFDTSGIHRQGVPMLQRRHAIFYNYHDPTVALQKEDVDYYRYHPLTLNAAFLGNLTSEDQRILGFGRKTHYQPDFERKPKHQVMQRTLHTLFVAKLLVKDLPDRIKDPIRRLVKK
jgi:ectoine hydroxylase-related dioxygenase (phytanoyl-CoA dioxygenase family)